MSDNAISMVIGAVVFGIIALIFSLASAPASRGESHTEKRLREQLTQIADATGEKYVFTRCKFFSKNRSIETCRILVGDHESFVAKLKGLGWQHKGRYGLSNWYRDAGWAHDFSNGKQTLTYACQEPPSQPFCYLQLVEQH